MSSNVFSLEVDENGILMANASNATYGKGVAKLLSLSLGLDQSPNPITILSSGTASLPDLTSNEINRTNVDYTWNVKALVEKSGKFNYEATYTPLLKSSDVSLAQPQAATSYTSSGAVTASDDCYNKCFDDNNTCIADGGTQCEENNDSCISCCMCNGCCDPLPTVQAQAQKSNSVNVMFNINQAPDTTLFLNPDAANTPLNAKWYQPPSYEALAQYKELSKDDIPLAEYSFTTSVSPISGPELTASVALTGLVDAANNTQNIDTLKGVVLLLIFALPFV